MGSTDVQLFYGQIEAKQDLLQRGDSNEYTQYTIFNMNKKNTLNYPKSAAMDFFPRTQE